MGETRRVEIPYSPRRLFQPYHDRTARFSKIVAHRRFGKTVGTINDTVRAALLNGRAHPPPRYGYVAPTYTQAKDVAWGYLKHYTAPFPDLQSSESELWVQLPTGARIRLYGADNYERLRGLYFDGLVIDEPALMDPRAWPEVMRPTLSDHSGWATFIGTPAGRNWFYRVDRDQDGKELPDWFRLVLKASETGVLDEAELADARRTLSADQYEREYECSFDAMVQGAYYAEGIKQLRAQKRLGKVGADPYMTYRAFWDLGGTGAKSDHTVIWIAQFVQRAINVLDYYEAQGQPLAAHIAWLRQHGYDKCHCTLPHDGATHDRVYSVSFESALEQAGFEVAVVPNQGRGAASARIEATRRLLPRVWMNEATCTPGLDALAAYHSKRDEERGIDLGPEHDWSSHAADAFGLMCISYEEPSVKKSDRWKPGKSNTTWVSRL